MSREEAHRHPAAGSRRATAAPSATERTTDEAAPPQRPLFTARTDDLAGAVRTRGHLDRIGAEILCGVVTALQHRGHRQIVVQLGPTTVVDDDARSLLADRARRLLADDGVRLHVR